MPDPGELFHVAGRNHVLVTANLAVKGTVWPMAGRLADQLRKAGRVFARVREAEVVHTRTGETRSFRELRLPVDRILLAHEYVDLGGDPFLRRMHAPEPRQPALIGIADLPGLLLRGSVGEEALDAPARFLTVVQPEVARSPAAFDYAAYLGRIDYLLVNRRAIEAVLCGEVTRDAS